MSKTIAIALLVAASACGRQQAKGRPVPESAIDEKNQTMAAETSPMEPETVPTPSEQVLAGGSGTERAARTEHASAVLRPTRSSKVRGTIRFEVVDGVVQVIADVKGLPKGKHAFHVHEYGDCSARDAKSAGDHFDFTGHPMEHEKTMITGNLGELTARANGTAHVTAMVPDATLDGESSIVGRSVVVHQKGNDETHPPDGAAGKRLACGVITPS